MRRLVRSASVVGVTVAAMTLAACSGGSGSDPSPTASGSASATTAAPDVSLYESGPESPLGYGIEVPTGATQVGPLIRIRSTALIEAYEPALEEAETEQANEEREKAEQDEEEGKTPTTPTPTPTSLPSKDSFSLLDEPPRPDTSLSVMRIQGNPTKVLRRMLAQVAALLPDAKVPVDDIASVCKQKDKRVTGCSYTVRGTTAEDRDVEVDLTIDPGNVTTRTAPVASLRSPVMTLRVSYVGDPKVGQEKRESADLGSVENVEDVPDDTGLIWPRMDIDAEAGTPLVGKLEPPEGSRVLLSGFTPPFAMLYVDKAQAADQTSLEWVKALIDGEPTKDVVEDLNEVSTTYSGTAANGTRYSATHVLSARGNYVLATATPRS